MSDTIQASPLLPGQLTSISDLEQLRERVYESHASYEQFLEEVLQEAERTTEAGGAEPDKSLVLAAGFTLIGRREQGVTWLEQAPPGPLTHYLRGQAERACHRFDAAIEQFDLAARSEADLTTCQLEKAETYLDAHRLEEAADLLKEIRPTESHQSQYAYLNGCLLAAQGHYEQALDSLDASVEAGPHNARAHFKRAFLLDLYGQDAAALEAYRNCTATPPVHVNALINLAMLYKERGEWDEAEKCLRAVLDTVPDHPRAMLFLKDVRSSRTMFYDEDQERTLESRNALLELPISEFELSVRSRNCLKKMHIETLRDLLQTTENDLMAYKNFGETSLTEIKNMLEQKNLHLGQLAKEEVTIVAACPAPTYAPPGSSMVLSRPVSEVELSVRSRKCLQRLGIVTLGDLASRTEAELLGTKNFGVTSLNEIKQRLADHGLSLRRLED